MKFEDALTALRNGAKIWHPTFYDNECLVACRSGLEGNILGAYRVGLKDDTETPFNEKYISIVKMKKDKQVDEMAGIFNYVSKIKKQLMNILIEEDYEKYRNTHTNLSIYEIFDKDIFKFPQLNLLIIMSDEWMMLEDEK
jgi:hypothetical protein